MDKPKSCDSCRLRAHYERNPRSLLGRIWRWHIRWCPGWKKYMLSLSQEEQENIRQKLHLG